MDSREDTEQRRRLQHYTYMLYDRCLEHEQTVFVCYVDYKKAFHRVNWTGLMEILTEKQNQQELEEENGRCCWRDAFRH